MTAPIKPETPAQIGDVVGVDRMDSIDRQKLDPLIKLQLLCAEAKVLHGNDPRSGGFSIVGRPRVILQLLLDLQQRGTLGEIRLERPVILGKDNADCVGWWCNVPILVRSNVVNDQIWIVKDGIIPQSQGVDRQRAGQLRTHAHAGMLQKLREP